LGGFVVDVCYGIPRRTQDLDYIRIIPRDAAADLHKIAGEQSALAETYGLHIEHVGVADLPASYTERLTEVFPGRFKHLRLLVLDPHDLALSKLTRNSPTDRDDVEHLAKQGLLKPDVLRSRYTDDFRQYIQTGDLKWHDKTLDMWIAAYLSA
jgi:hypothetical protein